MWNFKGQKQISEIFIQYRSIFGYIGASAKNFTVAAKSIGHPFYATLSFVCHFAATALDFQGLNLRPPESPVSCDLLTDKPLETNGCIISTMATAALLLKHLVIHIHIHIADYLLIVFIPDDLRVDFVF